ncbi:MAG: deoxyribose-phosphate aldolase [Caldiserica bacterium]|nr:MAG: deoxyribose-phosphate aldolase [Caldisericota bacterium]
MFYIPVDQKMTKNDIAKIIDHTQLKAETTCNDIIRLCTEAKKYSFGTVCVNSGYVALAKKQLTGTSVKIASVVGFPLGAMDSVAKAFEAERAITLGANEIDMVMNIGELKSENYKKVEEDIKYVVDAVNPTLVKVIIETALLTAEEKPIACSIAVSAGAKYVKTSTGFSKGGATIEDVKLMRMVVGKNIGVKAAGGIHDFETAVKMVQAGASRIGASKSVEIVS